MKTTNLLKLLSMLGMALVLVFNTSCDSEDDNGGDVTPAPTASFTFDPENPIVGDAITFTNTTENGATYAWSFGDGNTSTEQSPVHTYENEGSFAVTLVATNETGADNATATVVVGALPKPTIYFSEANELKIRKLVQGEGGASVEDFINTTGYVISLYYDEPNGHIYYGDDDEYKIMRVNIDGTGEIEIADIDGPRGMVVNNGFLYVNSRAEDAVYKINLSNNEKEVLYSFDDFFDNANFEIEGVLLEGMTYHNGFLYITAVDFDAENVWKAAVDGSSLELIIDFDNGGYGYSVAYHKTENKIYFHDDNKNAIFKANNDGSGIEKVLDVADRAWGLAIDEAAGKIYWSTRDGDISSANLDGSERTALAENLNQPRGIFLRVE